MKSLITLYLFFNLIFTQYNLSGFVKDDKGEAVIQISVYLDNTTLGATTDAKGFYEIKNIPSGHYNLIATSPGFRTFSMNIEVNANKSVSLSLEEQIYKSEIIVVIEKKPREWRSMLRKFKREFLGENDFAAYCNIENPEVMNFTRYNSNEFNGFSEKELIVRNNALGYQLSLNVISFSSKTNNISYSTNIRFKELYSNDKDQIILWKKNRKKAFEFSSIDLFQYMYNEESSDKFHFYVIDNLPRESNYPRSKVNYKDYIATDKYGDKYIYTENYLIVEAKTPVSNDYRNHSRNTIFSKDIRPITIIEFKDKVYLNKSGIVDTKVLKYYGYLAFLRVSAALPLDYSKNQH